MIEKKKKKKYIIIAVVSSAVLFSSLIYTISNPPEFLREFLKNQLEEQILSNTGLISNLNKISKLKLGLFNQTVVLDGIEILNGNNYRAEKILVAGKLEASFNTFNYLFGTPENSKLKVVLIEPRINLKRKKDGSFAINSPLFKDKKTKNTTDSTYTLPQIDILIKNGLIHYKDFSFVNKLELNEKIELIALKLDKKSDLEYKTIFSENKNNIDVNGTINIKSGKGNIKTEANYLNISKLINVFYDLSKGKNKLKLGDINLSAKASWDNFKLANLKFNTDLGIKNIIAKTEYYKDRVTIEDLKINLTEQSLNIDNLKILGGTYNALLKGSGTYNGSNPSLLVNLETTKLSLDKIMESAFIPESVKKLNLTGNISSSSNIKIDLEALKTNIVSYPTKVNIKSIKGYLLADKGTFLNSKYQKIKTKFELNNKDLILSKLDSDLYYGNLSGYFSLKNLFDESISKATPDKAFYAANLKAQNINYSQIINDFKVKIPTKYNPYGKVSGDFTMSGKLVNPKLQGFANAQEVLFKGNNNFSIKNLQAKFSYDKDNISIKSDINNSSFGNTHIDFDLKKLNAVKVSTKLKNFNFHNLNYFVPNLNFKQGIANGTIKTYFSIKNLISVKNPLEYLDKLNIKANLDLKNSDFSYQKAFSTTDTSGKLILDLEKGKLKSKISSLLSNEYGNLDGYFSFDQKTLNANFTLKNLPIASLPIKIYPFTLKSGKMNLNSKSKINLASLNSKHFLASFIKNSETDSKLGLSDVNLNYSMKNKSFNIKNLNSNINLVINNGILTSDLLLTSKETGEIKANFNSTKADTFTSFAEIKKLDLTNFNLISGADIKKGDSSFIIKAKGNLNNITKTVEASGSFKVNDLKASFKNTYPINFTYLDNSFVYKNQTLNLITTSNSSEIGDIKLNLKYLNTNSNITANLKIIDNDISKLKTYIKTDSFSLDKGKADVNLNFYSNLNNLLKNFYDFKLNSNTKLNNLEFTYPYKEQKATETIDSLALDVSFNYFIIASNIKLKKNTSELNSKQSIDINKMTSNTTNDFASINLSAPNLNFKDFKSIDKFSKIYNGNVSNLKLAGNISNDLSKSFVKITGDINNLQFSEKSSFIDKIHVNSFLKSSNIVISNTFLKKENNYFNLDGSVDISDLEKPVLDLEIASRKFPIGSIFSLLPLEVLEKIEAYSKPVLKNKVSVTYKMPLKKKNTEKIALAKIIEYWEDNKLDPETEKKEVVEHPFWEQIAGDMSISAKIKGPYNTTNTESKLLISNANIYSKKLSEIFLDFSYNDGEIKIPNLHLIERDGGYLDLNGSILKNDTISLEAQGKVNINTVKPFVKSITGETEGDAIISASIRGTKKNPDVSLLLESQGNGVLNDVYFDKISFLGSYKDKIAEIMDLRIKSGIKEARASGLIPIDKEAGEMNVSFGLKGESLGLINIFTKQVEWIKGDGDVFVNLQGSLAEPLMDGQVNLANAELYLPSLNKSLENVGVDIKLNNNFIKINRANALLNGSKANLFGQIDLQNFKPFFFKLKFSADDFIWEQENMNIRSIVSVDIKNTISEPIIGGRIQVKKGEMYIGLGSRNKGTTTTTPKIKDKIKVTSSVNYRNLKVEIPEGTDFWVRSPFFDLRPHGKINLREGDLYNPKIEGLVKIDKGDLYVLNNQFTVKEATADFTERKKLESEDFPINPDLTFIATTKLTNPRTNQDSEVEAKILADLEDIQKNRINLTWTKTGGMTDSEIWTQIVGLKAAQELIKSSSNSASTLVKYATPYLSRALFNPLTSKVADLFKLDEFSLGLASDNITTPGVTIAISKPIFEGISIGYQGTIRTSTFAQYNFFGRYKLSNNLSLKANLDERASLSLQGEFGYIF